jgi:uncharacterized protein (UPF0548 family)
MVHFSYPTPQILQHFAHKAQNTPFSYPNVGATKGDFPESYDHDRNEVYLGEGDAVWENAKNAIKQWRMFPDHWAAIFPNTTPIEVGKVVVMTAKVMGVWWKNTCRIVYVVDEPNRFGFAYGTLTAHVEKGEELFMVTRDENGQVFYKLQAFSKPRFWMARLAYPIARAYQKKFVRDSKTSMGKFSQNPMKR